MIALQTAKKIGFMRGLLKASQPRKVIVKGILPTTSTLQSNLSKFSSSFSQRQSDEKRQSYLAMEPDLSIGHDPLEGLS
jgi:hypothetical protein